MALGDVRDSLPVIVTGATLLGCCSLAMPAMTSVAMSTADPTRTGLASGVFNTARQSGGALGVALLGALLHRDSATGGSLAVPMLAVAVAYLAAAGATMVATRADRTATAAVPAGRRG